MSDAAPPPWVKSAPGLSAAHKFMLQVLWGYGPYAGREKLWIVIDGDRQPVTPAQCWEPCSRLAELTDQPEATVRKQLRRLAADGWILRGSGSMRTLAWRAPRVFAYGALSTSGQGVSTRDPGGSTSGHVHQGPEGNHQWSGGVHEGPGGVSTRDPQTLQEHSNLTSINTTDDDAADTPRHEEHNPHGHTRADDHDHRHPRGPEPDELGQGGGVHGPGGQRTGQAPEPRGVGPCGDRGGAGAQLDAFGSPEPVADRDITPAEIREWWAKVYLPLRREVFGRWRPDARIRDLACGKTLVSKLRKLLAEYCPGDSTYQLGALAHVARAAAARVDKNRGAEVDYRGRPYDTMKNIEFSYWATDKHFPKLLAFDLGPPGTRPDGLEPLPEYTPDPDDPYANMQAHQLEREMM